MVSKRLIYEYDFKTIYDYFEYIVSSIINGQRQQAENLVGKLSKGQKSEFFDYIYETYNDEMVKDITKLIINS